MRKLIDGLQEVYGEDVKLIKTLMKRESIEEFPEQLKWALQMLYFTGARWVEICRIDNYPHGNHQGSHIHIGGRVKYWDCTFGEAEERIKEISKKILQEQFRVIRTFEG